LKTILLIFLTFTYIQASEAITLDTQIIKANKYYKQKEYEKALKIYIEIKSKSKDIKQALFYNIANCFAMLGNYNDAKKFYVKSLQLKDDKDARYNLKQIIFLQNKKIKDNGKTIQSSKQNNSNNGNFKESKKNKNKKNLNKVQDEKQLYKIGSKTYELINKGYIYENKPW